ncbi:integrin alpha-E-like [Oppia nitens]|uniref:integrin alpha-E-like n=1 Tax=Oppia nitens TaxID=1686743 RepID=UPI0023DC032C|nr:integrin alpha-E-like [Oppia nitens]
MLFDIINCDPIDLTLVPGSIGQDVVEASIAKVNQIKLFADDSGLLFRLALVESNFGENPRIFTANDNTNESSNIWSIDSQKFRETKDIVKHPELVQIYTELMDKFHINWQTVSLNDMQRPLYGALATKIFLHLTVGRSIPIQTVDEQAIYWKQYYTTNTTRVGDVDSVDKFLGQVYNLEDLYECQPHINLCIVLDGSGSIRPKDFQLAKDFLYNITAKISSLNGNYCLVLYSDYAQTIYDYTETNLTNRLQMIRNLKQFHMTTNSRAGIQQAVDIMQSSQSTLPYKTMFLLTDGKSNDGVEPALSNAKKSGIKSWVWGVGPGVNVQELLEIAYKLPDNVRQLTKYSGLRSELYAFKQSVCTDPLPLNIDQKFDDILAKRKKQYFVIDLTKTTGSGINLTVQTTNGKLLGYYAYSTQHPSSAVNDDQFADVHNPIYIPGQQQHKQVYVAIEGQLMDNAYSIIATNV